MIWRRRKCTGPSEAEQAVADSQERLDETKAQTPAIKALAAELRKARMENHFAERIRQALEGRS